MEEKKKNLSQKPKKSIILSRKSTPPWVFFSCHYLPFLYLRGKRKGKKKGKDQRRRILKNKIKNLNSLADIC
jgi:hypothetical protein